MEKRIALYENETYQYPKTDSLFRPSEKYPEYQLEDLSDEKNIAYESVRECFHLLGYDGEHYGMEQWNPLKDIVHPGDTVLIKPNLVMDFNFNPEGGTDCLYTQPGLVAAVIDYVIIAQKGYGSIVIGDAPMQECNFQKLIENSGYNVLIDYYQRKGYAVKLIDFRELSSVVKNGVYYSIIKTDAKGKIINLGRESDFYDIPERLKNKMRITNYDPRILLTHHHGEIQEYYISEFILNADVIINMPKPKTHRKAGVTISLKNFVGANVRKEFLPHHTLGSLAENGDEYLNKSLVHKLKSLLLDKKNICVADKQYKTARVLQYIIKCCSGYLKLTGNNYAEGSWYGNHTISKTISDLNKIVLYADKEGIMRESPQRKILIVADMIVSGEKEGPVNPTSKNVGIVAVGDNPLLFDEAITTLMGFDIKKIPTFQCIRAWNGKYKIFVSGDYAVFISNKNKYNLKRPLEITSTERLNYEATNGWKGHIEL